MSSYAHVRPDDASSVRALARSLLTEALRNQLTLPPPVPRRAVRRSTGRTPYWTRAHIVGAMQGFVTRCGRLPIGNEWYHAQEYGIPARQTIMRHFGSMEALRKALAIHGISRQKKGM